VGCALLQRCKPLATAGVDVEQPPRVRRMCDDDRVEIPRRGLDRDARAKSREIPALRRERDRLGEEVA